MCPAPSAGGWGLCLVATPGVASPLPLLPSASLCLRWRQCRGASVLFVLLDCVSVFRSVLCERRRPWPCVLPSWLRSTASAAFRPHCALEMAVLVGALVFSSASSHCGWLPVAWPSGSRGVGARHWLVHEGRCVPCSHLGVPPVLWLPSLPRALGGCEVCPASSASGWAWRFGVVSGSLTLYPPGAVRHYFPRWLVPQQCLRL